MESSHDKDEYFTIGDCDLCGEDNRYVEHGKDTFGVHVIDYCAYGCNNEKSNVDFWKFKWVCSNRSESKRGLSERHSSRAIKKEREKKYKVFWTDVS